MVVPFVPGGIVDIVARVVAEGMRSKLGQPVIIENAGGADGSIGTGRVAHAAPDGYTLIAGPWNTHVANSVIYPLQYDVVKDFEPIGLLADAPMLLIVNKAIPANNLSEFIAWLKANPDKSSMGTAAAEGDGCGCPSCGALVFSPAVVLPGKANAPQATDRASRRCRAASAHALAVVLHGHHGQSERARHR
jgi:tripartite-type tricarboxylate transporter receptor subunit TctC